MLRTIVRFAVAAASAALIGAAAFAASVKLAEKTDEYLEEADLKKEKESREEKEAETAAEEEKEN